MRGEPVKSQGDSHRAGLVKDGKRYEVRPTEEPERPESQQVNRDHVGHDMPPNWKVLLGQSWSAFVYHVR